MRISPDPAHPDHLPLREARAQGKACHVFLDCVELDKCVQFADDEAGYVVVDVLDRDGNPTIDFDKKEWVTERREGEVRIEFRDRA